VPITDEAQAKLNWPLRLAQQVWRLAPEPVSPNSVFQLHQLEGNFHH
jgi:hypothetical protein